MARSCWALRGYGQDSVNELQVTKPGNERMNLSKIYRKFTIFILMSADKMHIIIYSTYFREQGWLMSPCCNENHPNPLKKLVWRFFEALEQKIMKKDDQREDISTHGNELLNEFGSCNETMCAWRLKYESVDHL